MKGKKNNIFTLFKTIKVSYVNENIHKALINQLLQIPRHRMLKYPSKKRMSSAWKWGFSAGKVAVIKAGASLKLGAMSGFSGGQVPKGRRVK